MCFPSGHFFFLFKLGSTFNLADLSRTIRSCFLQKWPLLYIMIIYNRKYRNALTEGAENCWRNWWRLWQEIFYLKPLENKTQTGPEQPKMKLWSENSLIFFEMILVIKNLSFHIWKHLHKSSEKSSDLFKCFILALYLIFHGCALLKYT